MLQLIRKLAMALGVIAAVGAVFAGPALAAVEVTTEAPTEVTEHKATLHATVKTEGKEVLVGFEYGLEEGGGKGTEASQRIPAGSGTVKVNMPVESLTPGSTYYVRAGAYAFSGGEGAFGKTLTFDTFHQPRFEGLSYPVSYNSSLDSGTSFKVILGEAVVECSGANFYGANTAAATSLSASAEFSGCTFSGNPAAVRMNSCSWGFSVANAGPPYTGGTSISCSKAGDGIEVEAGGFCKIKIPAQTPGGSVAYENKGEGNSRNVHAQVSGSGLSATKVEGPFCFLVGTKGTFSGAFSLSRADGKAGGFFLAGEKVRSLRIVGEGSGEEAKQPKWEAHEYPATLGGSLASGTSFKVILGEAVVECTSGSFSGESAAASSSLTVGAAFSGCTFSGNPAAVRMNSCSWGFSVANAGPPYTGGTSISCSKGGDAIEVEAGGFCKIKIPAQTPGGSVAYENKGEGGEATGPYVHAQVSASGLSATKIEGPFCFLVGTKGTLSAGLILDQSK